MSNETIHKSSGGRTLVNSMGIPSILFLVYLGGVWFFAFITIVSILALREFYSLGGRRDLAPNHVIGYAMTFLISVYYFFGVGNPLTILRPGELFLLATVVTVLAELFRNKHRGLSNITMTLAGILYIPLLLGTIIGLRGIDPLDPSMGMKLTFCLFLGVWACDSSAFFVGMKWGREKILGRVSPKKTVAGGVGGLVAAALFFFLVKESAVLSSQYSMAQIQNMDFLVFTVIIGIFGQAGDFAESLMKRDMGVKDTSSFLAGHGGVLDRFDSLLIASPLMFIYVKHLVY